MKVGIHSFYFDSYGGGERYILSIAEFFLKRGDDVYIFSGNKLNVSLVRERFQIDLSKAKFEEDIFGSSPSVIRNILTTAKFDLFFFLSNGSVPTSFAKRNFLHFQAPFHGNYQSATNKLKLSRFEKIIVNSRFTKSFIDKSYGVSSVVLYPPIDIESFKPGKKTNTILSVGRFFANPHNKKQDRLIDIFSKSCKKELKNWKLVLIGGVTSDKEAQLQELKNKVKDLPIEVISNGSFSQLKKAYSEAKIYWHAAGFEENLELNPEKAEHFGISTVEAMAAGCIPIVFSGGGQKEIIEEGKSGFFWETDDQLVKTTMTVINDEKLAKVVSLNAINRAKIFSVGNFFIELEKICA